ncbi:hypothetical protein GCM10022381_39430 [Leifsonia kafniensis]|uniref:Class C sortase n=1 Tax=Leifsonia kafniensis TaxID=475957 RepID=A0ABP7L648_9MICO
MLLYPTAAAWFSDRIHATEVSGYVAQVENLRPADQQKLLDDAHAFNAALPSGPIRDPFTLNSAGEQSDIGSGADAYEAALNLDSDGVMGRIDIPTIDVHLPIFHGTSEETLAKGVGNLFGSALPVGGESTHSVLTAHSGFVTATLFDDLKTMKTGDVFSITVVNETIYYEVDQILTVLPDETEALRRVDGNDYVTLITCTPTGVNTHRLLVRGERIEAPAQTDATTTTQPSDTTDPGLPWWALAIVGMAIAAVLLTRRRKEKPRPVPPAAKGHVPEDQSTQQHTST